MFICKIIVLKQSNCNYKKRLLLRCIHHIPAFGIHSFKWDLINNMGQTKMYAHFGYWTLIWLLTLHLLELFIWGREWKSSIQIGGWSYIERSGRSCIRNRWGWLYRERGLISRKDGGRSRIAGFERVCIRDTSRIRSGIDTLFNQSGFFPDQTRPSHKNWWALVVGGSTVWCKSSFSAFNVAISRTLSIALKISSA